VVSEHAKRGVRRIAKSSVPLTLSGDVIGENLALSDTITAAGVTLTNASGTSNSVSADVR
jgi:hypothetical protein